MHPDEITDRETLERFLDLRPRQVRQVNAIHIAQRAALRVAPLWIAAVLTSRTRKDDMTALPILRSILTSGVARSYPTPEVKTAAAAAFSEAALSAAAFSTRSAAARSAAAAAAAARSAADVAFSAAEAADAAFYAADAADAAADAAAAAATWDQIRIDAAALLSGTAEAEPLWRTPPDWFTTALIPLRTEWALTTPGGTFWLRWFEAAVAGRPLNRDLQRAIALIPDEDWKQGEARVAELIAGIELSCALKATQNGELVEFNPETGKLRLVPDTDLPADIGEYARRKLTKARALFPDDLNQQHRAIAPELVLLSETLADACNLPVEIFDTCASISRRIAARVRNGECPSPEQDAVLGDFLTRIRDTGADILGNDPKTQQALTNRNAILGNSALIEGQATLTAAAHEISVRSEGPLARLPVLVETATSADADGEDRKVASVKAGSRLIQVVALVGKIVLGGMGAGLYGVAVLQAIEYLAASPVIKTAFQTVLKYLNF